MFGVYVCCVGLQSQEMAFGRQEDRARNSRILCGVVGPYDEMLGQSLNGEWLRVPCVNLGV